MVSYYKLQLSLTMLIMYETRYMKLVNSLRFIGVGLMASTIRLNHVVYSSFLGEKIDKSICTCAKSLISLKGHFAKLTNMWNPFKVCRN